MLPILRDVLWSMGMVFVYVWQVRNVEVDKKTLHTWSIFVAIYVSLTFM